MDFNINFNVYLHHVVPPSNPVSAQITKLEIKIMSAMEKLISEVAEVKTVNQAAITLLAGLKAKLDEAIANGADLVKLQELADSLDMSGNDLAAAITANTPAEPQPETPAA